MTYNYYQKLGYKSKFRIIGRLEGWHVSKIAVLYSSAKDAGRNFSNNAVENNLVHEISDYMLFYILYGITF